MCTFVFASGGSKGYDHKVDGITAKGAWECTKRHFKELDVDPESDEISIVGIGDMSGDVFGNGLLRSQSAKLLAAFDHRSRPPDRRWRFWRDGAAAAAVSGGYVTLTI